MPNQYQPYSRLIAKKKVIRGLTLQKYLKQYEQVKRDEDVECNITLRITGTAANYMQKT